MCAEVDLDEEENDKKKTAEKGKMVCSTVDTVQ